MFCRRWKFVIKDFDGVATHAFEVYKVFSEDDEDLESHQKIFLQNFSFQLLNLKILR